MIANLPILPGHLNALFILGALYRKIIRLKLTAAKVKNKNKLVIFATVSILPTKVKMIATTIVISIAIQGVLVLPWTFDKNFGNDFWFTIILN